MSSLLSLSPNLVYPQEDDLPVYQFPVNDYQAYLKMSEQDKKDGLGQAVFTRMKTYSNYKDYKDVLARCQGRIGKYSFSYLEFSHGVWKKVTRLVVCDNQELENLFFSLKDLFSLAQPTAAHEEHFALLEKLGQTKLELPFWLSAPNFIGSDPREGSSPEGRTRRVGSSEAGTISILFFLSKTHLVYVMLESSKTEYRNEFILWEYFKFALPLFRRFFVPQEEEQALPEPIFSRDPPVGRDVDIRNECASIYQINAISHGSYCLTIV